MAQDKKRIEELQDLLYDATAELIQKEQAWEVDAVAFLYLTKMVEENLSLREVCSQYTWENGASPEVVMPYQDLKQQLMVFDVSVRLVRRRQEAFVSDVALASIKTDLIMILYEKFKYVLNQTNDEQEK